MAIDRQTGTTVEELGSGSALERIAGADVPTVTRRAQAGDPEARAAFEAVAGALAVGVMNPVFLVMPGRVVIGGGVSRAGDLLLDPIRARIAREGPRLAITPEVVVATGGDEVGLRGAFALWQDVARGESSLNYTLPRKPDRGRGVAGGA